MYTSNHVNEKFFNSIFTWHQSLYDVGRDSIASVTGGHTGQHVQAPARPIFSPFFFLLFVLDTAALSCN